MCSRCGQAHVPTWDRGDSGPLCNPRVAPPPINGPRARVREFREVPGLRAARVLQRKRLCAHVRQNVFRCPPPREHNHRAKDAARAHARADRILVPTLAKSCVARASKCKLSTAHVRQTPSRGPQLPLGCNASRDACAVQGSCIPSSKYKAQVLDSRCVTRARAWPS